MLKSARSGAVAGATLRRVLSQRCGYGGTRERRPRGERVEGDARRPKDVRRTTRSSTDRVALDYAREGGIMVCQSMEYGRRGAAWEAAHEHLLSCAQRVRRAHTPQQRPALLRQQCAQLRAADGYDGSSSVADTSVAPPDLVSLLQELSAAERRLSLLFGFLERCGALQMCLESDRRERVTTALLQNAQQRLTTLISMRVRQCLAVVDGIDMQLSHSYLSSALSGQTYESGLMLARRQQACAALGELSSLLRNACAPLAAESAALAERAAWRAGTSAPSAISHDGVHRLHPVLAALATLRETQEALRATRAARAARAAHAQAGDGAAGASSKPQLLQPSHVVVPDLSSLPCMQDRPDSSETARAFWPLSGAALQWSPTGETQAAFGFGFGH